MKELFEKRNDLVEQMSNIVNTAKAEARAVSEDEAKQFKDCEAEIAKIDNTIEMEKKMENFENKTPVAPALGDAKADQKAKDEKTFANMIRNFKSVEFKNQDDPMTRTDGAATIPTTIADRIISIVYATCPIFERSEHYNIKGNLVIPAEDGTNTNLVMTYADEFTEADSSKVAIKQINLGEFLGRVLCKVSRSLINNSKFDIVGYVIERMALAITKFLEKELLNGTTDKIDGLKGVTQVVETANVGEITGDDLIDAQEAILDEFQNPAIWIMSRNTRTAIRKIKNDIGQYLLNRDLTQKWGYELLGRPVYTTDQIDDNTIYYGDMTGLATKISEDMSINVLYEKYAEQHAVGVLGFVGIDAKVQNPQKIVKLTVKQS